MTTRLWLVRHGQTDWNLKGRFQGQADPPLNATGLRQAHDLAARLDGTAYAALYSSDLLRARQTAAALADRIGLRVRLDARLREVSHGVWDGLLVTEVQARYGGSWAERQRNPDVARPPGGETVVEVATRVAAALDDIARLHPGAEVLVVSHGLALATALCRAWGRPLRAAHDLVPPNAETQVLPWTSG